MGFDCIERTHVGCRRKLNEDALMARPDLGLWAVADGMGGHEAGEVASALIVNSLALGQPGLDLNARAAAADATLHEVNDKLVAMAEDADGRTIGSTVVAIAANAVAFTCLWVGDSRAYLLRDGYLAQLTRDHSLVQELVDAGVLEPDQARDHPRANVITRAIGVSELLQLDRADGRVESRDIFLLCSDGLTGALSEWEIASFLARADLDTLADDMLGAALAKPARDNVSFVLIRAR